MMELIELIRAILVTTGQVTRVVRRVVEKQNTMMSVINEERMN